MKIRALETIRVPAGTPLRLSFEQARARAHLLRFDRPVLIADREDYEGVSPVAFPDQTLEFKAGEVLDVFEPPKGWAGRIEILPDDETDEAEDAADTGPKVVAAEIPAQPRQPRKKAGG
jgi:hypothetical protein